VQQRLQLETDMRRGLIGNEFFLVYQPQIDLRSGRTMGVEALVRWRDPVRGVVMPADFIPVAEESGMIHPLGARVLREACRQVNAWHLIGMPLRLSVNLSVQQLQHEGWLNIVEEALTSSGLPSRYLDLEITESVIITTERAVDTLVKLQQRASRSPSTTSAPAIRACPISRACRSRASRSTSGSSADWTSTRATRRSPRRSSRCRTRSACASSPRASRPRRSSRS
jgi:hypothetical protein